MPISLGLFKTLLCSSLSTWMSSVAAMSKVENGRQANIKDVEEGYRLAFEII